MAGHGVAFVDLVVVAGWMIRISISANQPLYACQANAVLVGKFPLRRSLMERLEQGFDVLNGEAIRDLPGLACVVILEQSFNCC